MARNEVERETFDFDPDDGTIIGHHIKSITVKSKTSEEFYMVFGRFLGPVFHIKSVNDMHVLGLLCMMMEYNSAKVHLTTERRQEICTQMNILNSVLSRSLHNLKKLGLISGDRGTLEINPYIFWKGNSKDREKLLRTEGLVLKVKFKVEDGKK